MTDNLTSFMNQFNFINLQFSYLTKYISEIENYFFLNIRNFTKILINLGHFQEIYYEVSSIQESLHTIFRYNNGNSEYFGN